MKEILIALFAGTTGILFNKVLNAVFGIYKINATVIKKILSFSFYFLTPIILIVYGYFFLELDKSFVMFIAINFFVLIMNMVIVTDTTSVH